MKKKIKKDDKEKTFRSGEVMTLLENMNDKIEFVAEQHGGVIKSLDSIDARMDKMDVRLSGVEDKVGMSGVRLITIENELKALKRDNKDSFRSSLEYLSRIEEEIQSMKKEAKMLETAVIKKEDKEKIQNFEKRLIKLEKLVFAKLA